ncbi:MAG: camphor resistance protein CrcB [Bryobacterales bacterium]|jgi:CrcB protein|nr:camphor resistance protein CrcB [Bryobacterales bacterium]
MIYLWIAFGSALGGVARYACQGWAARLISDTFPWGTLIVNIVGCTFIGLFATLTGSDGRLLVGSPIRQFVMVGICGGYTTFSSFSLETLNLARDGQWTRVAANVLGSVALCLLGVWLGHIAASALNER